MGGTDRTSADTRTVFSGDAQIVELYLVLEGEKGGLPIYCSEFPTLRIDGRAIPARLVLEPFAAGLTGTEIHWVDLRPTAGGQPWRRTLLPRGDNQWSIPVLEFDGDSAPGIKSVSGTGRYAAAAMLPGRSASGLLQTDGWTIRPGWADPEQAPGLAVTRHRGMSLSGFARGFARLPVYANATLAHERNRVALAPRNLPLVAYEDLGGIRLDGPREEALDSESWSWLFEVIVPRALRRSTPDATAIGARGRPIAWGAPRNVAPDPVLRDDVILTDDGVAILLMDDGDGWLGNADFVLHTTSGEIAEGRFAAVPGGTFRVVRARNFLQLRRDLSDAGYGDLGTSPAFTPDVRRAVREFEADHGLPVDGLPDAAMRSALAEFLERLRQPGSAVPADDGP